MRIEGHPPAGVEYVRAWYDATAHRSYWTPADPTWGQPTQEAPTMTRPPGGYSLSALQRMTADELAAVSDRHRQAVAERLRLQGRGPNLPAADDELSPEEQAAVLAVGLQATVEQEQAVADGAQRLLKMWDQMEARMAVPDNRTLDAQARSEALHAMTTKVAGLTDARRDTLADLAAAAGLTEADING